MNRYKYLMKNIGLLTISSFGTKIFSFVLIPIYTSILSTSDYGLYELYRTTVSLSIPILTLNIAESVMRFSLDKSSNVKDIFSIGLRRVIVSSVVFSVAVFCNYYFGVIHLLSEYSVYLVFLFAFELLYELLSKFSRGVENVKAVAIAGAISSVTMISLNILFLVTFRMGLEGFFLANCCSFVVPCIYFIVTLHVWKYVSFVKRTALKKKMFSYSSPLVFNTIAWWINNASDRYVVTWLCGIALNGVYSVAYKIPSILNVFQSLFNQAWVLSAVKEFNANNHKFYENVYNIYNCAMALVCSLLIIFDKVIAKILFAEDFFSAWMYAPFLLISVLFGALSGLLGGIFSAAKKSKLYAKTTIVGAAVNIILDVVLVSMFGVVGAAVATMVSFAVVWAMRLTETKKIITFDITVKKHVLSYCILVLQSALLLLLDSVNAYIIQIVLFFIVVCCYKNEIILILKKRKRI